MTIWFTSDTHYSHRNVIRYCKRPFLVPGDTVDRISNGSVSFMNESMIDRYNSVVRPEDTVYHLGDFSIDRTNIDRCQDILKRLNGTKYLVRGNHDSDGVCALPEWGWVKDLHEFTITDGKHAGTHLVLCHYAMRTWHWSYKPNSIMLHGHSHGGLQGSRKSLDVGVDCWDWTPTNLNQIKARLATLPESRETNHHED